MGGGYFAVMSGPCSVESKEQITYVAQRVQAAGASILRGGAFKPRTSPYSFQGLRAEILLSSEVPEVFGMADRILVLKDGQITGEYGMDEINKINETDLQRLVM